MNGDIVQDNSMQAEIMGSSKTSSGTIQEDAAAECALTARVPGLLSLAAVPAAMPVNPLFFGLAFDARHPWRAALRAELKFAQFRSWRNCLWAGLCLVGAAYFMFRTPAGGP